MRIKNVCIAVFVFIAFACSKQSPSPSSPQGTLSLDTIGTVQGVFKCQRTVVWDTLILSQDSITIDQMPLFPYDACRRDTQNVSGNWYFSIPDTLWYPRDFLSITRLRDTTTVFYLKAMYGIVRWSDTVSIPFNKFAAGTPCAAPGCQRTGFMQMGLKYKGDGYYYQHALITSGRPLIQVKTDFTGGPPPSISELMAGRKADLASCRPSCQDPFLLDTVTYYHVTLKYPKW